MATIKLPELGEGVTEGELIKWLVKVGDSVKPDQAIAEIMTDKATVEVPSPIAGVVKDLHFKAGDMIKVDSVLISLDGAPSASPTNASQKASQQAPQAMTAPAKSAAGTGAGAATTPAKNGGATISVRLPELGEGVTEGELVKYLVKVGDNVKPDQAIAEIMTDKATVEVPSPISGQVTSLNFKAGDMVKVESVLLTLSSQDNVATVATGAKHSGSSIQPTAQIVSMVADIPSSAQSTGGTMGTSGDIYPPVADSRVLATPATRRLAREMNIDINQISGTGLAGRVTRDDVLKSKPGAVSTSSNTASPSARSASLAIPRPAYNGPAGAKEERVAIRGIRKKIAENMQMSKAIIPHFTLMDEADVSELVKLREEMKAFAEKNQTKITYLPFVMKALIATIREYPMFNASIDDAAQEIVYKKYFNLGFAADTPNGLVVPVIKNADQKTLLELSKEIVDLSTRAREGKLKPDEMKGATITITNIGSVGGTYATPIINHPEVAILGMYKLQDKLVMNAGKVESIKTMNFTVTADHRLIDGAVAANFLRAFFVRIQKPGVLMMEMI